MNPITELHSSHLSANCMKQVYLQHNGMYVPEMPSAMYKGSLAGKACEYLHENNAWDNVPWCMACAREAVGIDLEKENRHLTDAVKRDEKKIVMEVGERIFDYARRFGPLFSQCDHIGTELPVRWTLEHNSLAEPFPCASHIDLLCRDSNDVFGRGAGRLILVDQKYTDEAPTWDYVTRNQQMMLYQLVIYKGEVLLDDEWIRFEEWCASALIHLPSLHVYKKASGEFKKGDEKPLEKILLWTNFREDSVDRMKSELAVKARCFRNGDYPASPSAVGCMTCCSKQWCDRYDMAEIKESNDE